MTRSVLRGVVILSVIAGDGACASSSRSGRPTVATIASSPSPRPVAAGFDSPSAPDTPPPAPAADVERAPPPPDRDGDGVADPDDWCVDRPETINGVADEDGCPDTAEAAAADVCQGTYFTGGLGGAYFDSAGPGPLTEESLARATALPRRRRGRLDYATHYFRCHPTLKVKLAGHSDSREGARCAERRALSLARAEAVREYFIEQGVAAGRITIEAIGDDEPVGSNAIPRERAKNRRVEVVVWLE